MKYIEVKSPISTQHFHYSSFHSAILSYILSFVTFLFTLLSCPFQWRVRDVDDGAVKRVTSIGLKRKNMWWYKWEGKNRVTEDTGMTEMKRDSRGQEGTEGDYEKGENYRVKFWLQATVNDTVDGREGNDND